MNYYDQNDSPIYIPSSNQDAFIRRGYYGGHADTYKPYVMKTFAMPGGKPVWHGNLEGLELDDMFGFIEAYVVCPTTITLLAHSCHTKSKIIHYFSQRGNFGVYITAKS